MDRTCLIDREGEIGYIDISPTYYCLSREELREQIRLAEEESEKRTDRIPM